MTQEGQLPPPPVIWAQRKDVLFVTICLEDCKDPTIKIEPESIYFKGAGGTENKLHEVTIDLYQEIVPEQSVQHPKGRTYELVLVKKEEGPYWPRLMKESKKAHWLKSDFNKWKDETHSEDEASGALDGAPHLERLVRQMGESGGNGDSKPNFDDLDEMGDEGLDSDDDEMPDLE